MPFKVSRTNPPHMHSDFFGSGGQPEGQSETDCEAGDRADTAKETIQDHLRNRRSQVRILSGALIGWGGFRSALGNSRVSPNLPQLAETASGFSSQMGLSPREAPGSRLCGSGPGYTAIRTGRLPVHDHGSPLPLPDLRFAESRVAGSNPFTRAGKPAVAGGLSGGMHRGLALRTPTTQGRSLVFVWQPQFTNQTGGGWNERTEQGHVLPRHRGARR